MTASASPAFMAVWRNALRLLRPTALTVQPGDTVESLSHRMASIDRPAERFRGLDAHAQVKPRDRVKIVVD